MYSTKKSQKRHNKFAILAAVIIFTAGISAATYFVLDARSNDADTAQVTDQSDEPIINLDPPTTEEQEAGDIQKEVNLTRDQEVSVPNTAQIVIVDASQYDTEIKVRAFAANVISDGTCIITFTKDSESFEKQVPANADASSSPCVSLTVPRSEFSSPGQWQVVVNYTSTSLSGSAESILEIQ